MEEMLEEIDDIQEKSKYRTILKNTLTSQILKMHTQSLTSMPHEENTFIIKNKRLIKRDNIKVNKMVERLVDKYITENNISTEKQMQAVQAKIDMISHNTKKFLFSSSEDLDAITDPCVFERIYSLPIDDDDFLIDVRQSRSSTSGKAELNKMKKLDLINPNDNLNNPFIRPRNPVTIDNFKFFKYFITVELLWNQ